MDKAPPIEEMIADPESHFETPAQVVEDPNLSVHLKQKILESWKAEASHMAESVAENMGGGEDNRLREISQALLRLNQQSLIDGEA